MNEQAFLEEGLEFLEERLTVQECLAETVFNAAEGEGKIRFQQVVGLASDHRDEDAEFSGVDWIELFYGIATCKNRSWIIRFS